MADYVINNKMCLNKYMNANYNGAPHKFKGNDFSVFYTNVVSLKCNLNNLENHLQSFDLHFDLVFVAEIRNTNIYNISNLIDGYNFIKQLPLTKKFGGVGIFINSDLKYKIRQDLNFTTVNYESIFIEISNANKNWVFGVIYRHPNTNWKIFEKDFLNVCEKVQSENKNLLFSGDINLDLLKSNNVTKEFLFELKLNDVTQIIDKPTRETNKTATLIDHIYVSELLNFKFKHSVHQNSFSDHSSVIVTIYNESFENKERKLSRFFSKNNLEKFKKSFDYFVTNYSFEKKCSTVSEIEKLWSDFIASTTGYFNESFPLTKVSRKKNKDKPWINAEIKKMCKKKETLYKKLKTNPSDYRKKVYIEFKIVLNKRIFEAKKKYYENFLGPDKNNKKLWKHINIIKNGELNDEIMEIIANDQYINDPKIISNTFNQYFNSIGNKLSKNFIPSMNFQKYLPKMKTNYIHFQTLKKSDVNEKILSLNANSSSGHDMVTNKVLKYNNESFSKILCFLINNCINFGYYPSCLKISKIIPIHKAGSKSSVENYRPISMQCVLGKVFERLIYDKIVNFFNENKIFSKSQHGFKKFHSCQTALAVVHDFTLLQLEKKNM